MKSVMMKMIALAIMVGVVISVFAACTPQKPGTESSNGTVEQTQSTTVPTTVEKIAFTPVSVDNSSTIKVDGIVVKSGKKSQDISLDEGMN